MARRALPPRPPLRGRGDVFVDWLKELVGDGSTVRKAGEELVSLLARAEMINEATGLALRDHVLRTLAKPKFDWPPLEEAIGLASPAYGFRHDVTEAVVFSTLRHLAMSQPKDSKREDWNKAAVYFERAVLDLERGRIALACLLGDNEPDKWLHAEHKSLSRCAQLARLQANLIPKQTSHRPPMNSFRGLVQDLAAAFQRATGKKTGRNLERG